MAVRNRIIEVIVALYILLWMYAAVSKLLDFEVFSVQLTKSPVLGDNAALLAVLVPGVEIILAVLLTVPVFRLMGLIGSFLLMSAFTIYLFVITRHSSYVPCSCGGILEGLSWDSHIIFNLFFIGLSVWGIRMTLINKEIFLNRKKE